jgi:hypothetical protein
MSRKRSNKDAVLNTQRLVGMFDMIRPAIWGKLRVENKRSEMGFPMYDIWYDLSNRDVVRMTFISDSNDEITRECELRWWVSLYIGPRKNKDINMDRLSTGRVGLEGLTVAHQMMMFFMLTTMQPGQSVFVGGADSRRFRVYQHYLSRLGFRQTNYMGTSAMMFTIPADWKTSNIIEYLNSRV